ncbi:hypothetical protein B0H13DRAFT_1921277 [Mycena leptocephala]|nr:hypothetical protein B0H13DRAFT_1921277 [Mycena leptocephala]
MTEYSNWVMASQIISIIHNFAGEGPAMISIFSSPCHILENVGFIRGDTEGFLGKFKGCDDVSIVKVEDNTIIVPAREFPVVEGSGVKLAIPVETLERKVAFHLYGCLISFLAEDPVGILTLHYSIPHRTNLTGRHRFRLGDGWVSRRGQLAPLDICVATASVRKYDDESKITISIASINSSPTHRMRSGSNLIFQVLT